jgi:hypothetical protein
MRRNAWIGRVSGNPSLWQMRLSPKLCIQYVGFKIIEPTTDIGLDIAAEYEKAKELS